MDSDPINSQEMDFLDELGSIDESVVLEIQAPPNRYFSRSQLSHGGMKRIMRVRDTATARDVAMAVLSEESLRKAGVRDRFLQEARITANLEHPNIVPIHDIGLSESHTPFFTMKMLGGESLADILKKLRKNEMGYREKYSLGALLLIYLKILDAIAFAHSKGIIHLDIKPDNVQVGAFGEVVVLDWGLARSTGHPLAPEVQRSTVLVHLPLPDSHTVDGEIKGTVGFMAPEQAAGRNSEKDERTDIYALGAILYSMLTWRRSVKSEGKDTERFARALHDITSGIIQPMLNETREIPAGLRAVVKKSMSLKPAQRYESVGALRQEILNHMNGFATAAEHAGWLRRVYLWTHRHRILTLLSLVTGMVLLGGYFTWRDYQAKRIARWGHAQVMIPFPRENEMNRWIVHEGEWEVLPDRIRSLGNDAKAARIRLAQPIYGNVAIEFDAKVEGREALENGGDLSIILNWNPNNHEDGYFFQLGGMSNTVASIQRRNGFQAMIPFSLTAGKVYHIRVEKEGSHLRLFCDGKKLIEAEDMLYLEGGYLGLYTFGGGKRFWNLRIYERGVPEWVSPLTEGDGYFRSSRSCENPQIKEYLLHAARDAYSRVALEYGRTALGLQAILRRAYVFLELNQVSAAESDILMLENRETTAPLSLALLRGEVALRSRNFPSALDIFSRALGDFPGHSRDITGVLMARLSDTAIFMGNERYRNYFWRMAVEHQEALSFRCRTKSLDSIDFLKSMNFEMLDFSGNRIRDLTPIRDLPLRVLNCSNNPISSLTPLQGMSLESLDCSYTAIGTLEPLRGMPLKILSLQGCVRLMNISALESLPSLERLSLPSHLPRENLFRLRGKLPNLKTIQFDSDDWKTSPEQFFQTLIPAPAVTNGGG